MLQKKMLRNFASTFARRQISAPCRARAFAASARTSTWPGGSESVDVVPDLQTAKHPGFSRKDFVGRRLRKFQDFEDSYSVGEQLGAGATAKVYRATSTRTGEDVALKVITKSRIADPQMLRNEIQIHKDTDHPHISRLLQTFEDDDYLYLLTEMCEGGDLDEYLNYSKYGSLPEEDALDVFRQMIASVRYLHSMRIAHRDLKPGNFLCAATPEKGARKLIVKLTDFGASAQCREGSCVFTKTIGTDGFMAPEVLKGEQYDEKADIFSLGCILHTLLTGRPPRMSKDSKVEISDFLLSRFSSDTRSLIRWLTQNEAKDRPSIEELALSPLLQPSANSTQDASLPPIDHFLDNMSHYASYPMLKKAALLAMVSQEESDTDFLPGAEKFKSIGSHGSMNMAVSAHDIYTELSAESSISGHFQQVQQLMDSIGCNGTGALSYSEWLAATLDPSWHSDPIRIDGVFQMFDQDSDGMISTADLKSALPSVSDMLSECSSTSSWSQQEFSLLMCS